MAGKVWKISICMMLTVLLCACTGNDMMEKKVRDLDFTVVSAEDISEELKSYIDERKEETFTLSIRVNDLYLGEQSVCVSTSLEGPGSGKNTESEIGAGTVSYPYIVIKLETLDAPVIFDI